MPVGLTWAHTSVCCVIGVVYYNVYIINGRASPRGKGHITDEDSAPVASSA